jgi:hypothetical protein
MLRDISYIHSEEKFATHIIWSQRIDYMLSSLNLKPYIVKVGLLKFNDGLESDHCGLFCGLKLELFKAIAEIKNHQTRLIGTNSTNQEGEKYIHNLDS